MVELFLVSSSSKEFWTPQCVYVVAAIVSLAAQQTLTSPPLSGRTTTCRCRGPWPLTVSPHPMSGSRRYPVRTAVAWPAIWHPTLDKMLSFRRPKRLVLR
jgi:hypothetical protein